MAREIASVREGARVISIGACDVRSPESLQEAVDLCVKELGGIDFLIAGAAGNFAASIGDLSHNAFKAVMDIDVLGTFNTIKIAIPHLLRSSSPRIICVSSTFHYTGTPLQAHVSAAKASVDSLMASVALEYGPRGVTSNVIAPGPTAETEGLARLAGLDSESGNAVASQIPLGRMGTSRDIADATVFLFSDAGSYVNGHVLVVDGGSWRRQSSIPVGVTEGMKYPAFLVDGQLSPRIKDTRKKQEKL